MTIHLTHLSLKDYKIVNSLKNYLELEKNYLHYLEELDVETFEDVDSDIESDIEKAVIPKYSSTYVTKDSVTALDLEWSQYELLWRVVIYAKPVEFNF
jgi:hypothetical protein